MDITYYVIVKQQTKYLNTKQSMTQTEYLIINNEKTYYIVQLELYQAILTVTFL